MLKGLRHGQWQSPEAVQRRGSCWIHHTHFTMLCVQHVWDLGTSIAWDAKDFVIPWLAMQGKRK
eukprot:4956616-Amphidinium_carterae.1